MTPLDCIYVVFVLEPGKPTYTREVTNPDHPDDAYEQFCDTLDMGLDAKAQRVSLTGNLPADMTEAFLAGYLGRIFRGSHSARADFEAPAWREWNRSGSALSAAREAVAASEEADRIAAEESLAHERQESLSSIFIERKAS